MFVIDLGEGEALALNADGVMVGWSAVAATRWQHTRRGTFESMALGGLGGSYSSAEAINSAGVIVGSAATAAGEIHAVLWQNGSVVDLNDGVTGATVGVGVTLTDAVGINDSGEIVANGVDSTGAQASFVLIPVVDNKVLQSDVKWSRVYQSEFHADN